MNKRNQGITLIALVITIIILLILAGITISLVIGDNGILNKATEAGQDYSEQAAREKLEVELLDSYVEKTQNSQYNQNEYLTNKLIQKGFEVDGDIVNVDGWKFEIDRSIPQISKAMGKTDPTDQQVLLEYSLKENSKNIAKNLALQLKDNSNHGVDANLQNAELDQSLTGLVFNGTSTYSQLDSSKLQMTFPITVTIAVNCDQNSDNRVIFIDTNSKVGIGTSAGRLYVTAVTDSNYYDLPTDFYNNKINYITVVYTNTITDHQVYINGQKLARSSGIGCWGTDEVNSYLGRRNSGSYFKGTLYDLKIYHKAYTPEEVQEQYQNMKKFLETQENVQIPKEDLYLGYTIKNNTTNVVKSIPYILKDKTKNANDSIIQAGEYTNDKMGVVFNGTSTYGKLNNLNMKLPTTIEIVAKFEQDLNERILFVDSNSNIGIGTSAGKIYVTAVTESQCYNIPPEFYRNEINYITVVYNNLITEHELYINGQKLEESSEVGYWVTNGGESYLGRRDSGSYFKGILYKLKIYQGALSGEQIVKKYEQNKMIYE